MVNPSNPFRPSINRESRDGIMNVEIELNYTVNKIRIKLNNYFI